jgi:hypothetical protein
MGELRAGGLGEQQHARWSSEPVPVVPTVGAGVARA